MDGDDDRALGEGRGRTGYYIRIDNNTDPNDGFKLDTRNAAEFGTSATGGRGLLELCGWEFGRRAIRSFGTRWRLWMARFAWRRRTGRRLRYSHDGYGETYFGGPWQGKASGAPGRFLQESAASMKLPRARCDAYLNAMLHFANQVE